MAVGRAAAGGGGAACPAAAAASQQRCWAPLAVCSHSREVGRVLVEDGECKCPLPRLCRHPWTPAAP